MLFPAYAGVILEEIFGGGSNGAFPRIRGGDPKALCLGRFGGILFPAYAGVIPTNTVEDGFAYTFPRIRGGDPYITQKGWQTMCFSPHMRG